MHRIKKYFSLELCFWIITLLYLYFIDTTAPHLSFCIFKLFDVTACNGCGIGKSIALLIHGEYKQSISTHWLGTFALAMIVYRIVQLFFTIYKTNRQNGKSILTN
ncbi:MAG: DUF2752 domain-containing protein [Chitinophagales bacterium]|nr:DUF2752 domain-containing protein [Chitinophagales bacterium]HMX59564.1 DUF2752 domain-containing protein [Chitinophagales bacterium]HND82281.1 DUF2752 domain-containing protein [Chitinophagales bacterium]